jgi:hypothetical protein
MQRLFCCSPVIENSETRLWVFSPKVVPQIPRALPILRVDYITLNDILISEICDSDARRLRLPEPIYK